MQVAVIGLGRFGSNLAINLAENGAEVIAVDRHREAVESIADQVADAIILDTTEEKELVQRGIADVDVAVVAIGEDVQMSILTTAILRRLGVAKIVARATSKIQADILREVGAHEVLYIEEEYAALLARNIMSEATLERIPIRRDYSLAEVRLPETFIGKTLGEIRLQGEDLNVVAILTKTRDIGLHGETRVEVEVDEYPSPDKEIGEEDTLLIFGRNEKLDELRLS